MKKITSTWRAMLAVVFAAVLAIGTVSVATAAEFIVPEGEDGNISLSAGEEYRNLYLAGGNVIISSNTLGDLFVAGGNVTIEGSVEQDLFVAGGNVYINGPVGGDLRVAGGTVVVNNTIGGDLLAGAGQLSVTEKSSIGGDAVIGGGQATLDANVAGNLKLGGGAVVVNSTVTGITEIVADESVVFGAKAVIAEGSKYSAPKDAEIREGAQVNNITREPFNYKQGAKAGKDFGKFLTLGYLLKLVAMILVALVIVRLFPRTSKDLINSLSSRPWLSLLVGFVSLIVIPISVVLLFVVMVGFYAAFIVLFAWLLLMALSALLGTVFVGAYITKWLMKHESLMPDWQAIVIGAVALSVAMLIPVIGWLFVFLVFLGAFGAMLRQVYHHIKQGEGGEITVVEDQM